MSQLISLKCQKCQANLNGENNSKVFFCHTCGSCFNVGEDKLHEFPVLYIKPQIVKKMEQVYFPFWQFESQYTFHNEGEAGDYVNSRVFYIPAFFIKNINYFGDIGFYYMKKNTVLEQGSRRKLEVFPADRDINRAAQYPYIYMCKDNTKRIQNDFSNITMKHKKAAMALVPFYKTENYYYDSILFWKYPSGALI
jgi:hypothetical protein